MSLHLVYLTYVLKTQCSRGTTKIWNSFHLDTFDANSNFKKLITKFFVKRVIEINSLTLFWNNNEPNISNWIYYIHFLHISHPHRSQWFDGSWIFPMKIQYFGKYNWFSYATEILCNGIPIWLITQAYSMTSLISFINYSFVSLNSQFCHEFRLNQGFAIFWQSESTWRKVGVRYFAPIYSIYSVAMKYGTSKIYSGRK